MIQILGVDVQLWAAISLPATAFFFYVVGRLQGRLRGWKIAFQQINTRVDRIEVKDKQYADLCFETREKLRDLRKEVEQIKNPPVATSGYVIPTEGS